MRFFSITAFVLLSLLSVTLRKNPVQGQSSKPTVIELPPEEIPKGKCKASYSGYLETSEHGKPKDVNLSAQQIGDYAKRQLAEGYSLALYPQVSGRIFVIETCHAND